MNTKARANKGVENQIPPEDRSKLEGMPLSKVGYVSTDKTGVNKEAGARDSMPDFEGFESYVGFSYPGDTYIQDKFPPSNLQNVPDVKLARPGSSVSVPDRYY